MATCSVGMVEQGTHKTRHARQRQQQRGLSDAVVEAALAWGHPVRLRGGATAYYLGRRQRARAAREGETLRDFKDVAVIVGSEDVVITAYPCADVRRLRRRSR